MLSQKNDTCDKVQGDGEKEEDRNPGCLGDLYFSELGG